MKGLKKLETISPAAWQILAIGVIIAVFIFIFYYHFLFFQEYRREKNADSPLPQKITPISPPQFTDFTPQEADKQALQIFSIRDDGQNGGGGETGDDNGNHDKKNEAEQEYQVLGVVKKEVLYLVVRFSTGQSIRFFPAGSAIHRSAQVEKITPEQVVISDGNGREQIIKIFKFQYLDFTGHKKKEAAENQEKETIQDQEKKELEK